MNMQALGYRLRGFVVGLVVLAFCGVASADPPSRVARLGYVGGTVSFSPAGENDWVQASLNRPLGSGDRLWSDARARAEIQIGGAAIRLNDGTGVSILNLDDRITQLQLTQGTLHVRVRRLDANQEFEVDTPNLAFTLRQPGEYRIEVDPDADVTTIAMRRGRGEVYGNGASFVIDARQAYRFTGDGLRSRRRVDMQQLDDFDRWAGERDRAYDDSPSARYVSRDVIGYQDLDAHGRWRTDATYGRVWVPNRVSADWAPYRDGHWAWIDPWGWTWVDDAPWGFAVSHYGRWANLQGTWGWVPGPVRSRAYYAPALVVFVGGADFQLTISSGLVGAVGWFALGPREVYRPSYPVSRSYFERVNQSNTVIHNTVIHNVYNQVNVTQIVYANRQLPGAVIAVPTQAFVQSQPVSRAALTVSRDVIASRPVAATPTVAPTRKSVHGAAAARDKPPARVFDRPVVARTAPAAPHAGFEAQQPQLAARPGKPLDTEARRALKPAPNVPAPAVKVIVPPKEPPQPLVRPAPRATAPVAPAAPMAPAAPAPERRGARPEARSPAPPAAAPPAAAPRTPAPRAPNEPAREPARGVRQPEPPARAAASAADRSPPRVQPAPRAESPAATPRPNTGRQSDERKDADEPRRGGQDRKQKD